MNSNLSPAYAVIVLDCLPISAYPMDAPVISGLKTYYHFGEFIEASCTAPPSYPAPDMMWHLNGKEVTLDIYWEREVGNELGSSTPTIGRQTFLNWRTFLRTKNERNFRFFADDSVIKYRKMHLSFPSNMGNKPWKYRVFSPHRQSGSPSVAEIDKIEAPTPQGIAVQVAPSGTEINDNAHDISIFIRRRPKPPPLGSFQQEIPPPLRRPSSVVRRPWEIRPFRKFSSYLNRVLHLGAINGGMHSPSTPLVVILPPEISYRTMSILLQYMYSGEATVSNDQLNGVLRAGELLRVKGLCHAAGSPNKDKEKRYFSSSMSNQSETHSRAGSASSGRLSANYFQTHNQPSTSKTPEPRNPSVPAPAATSKVIKTAPSSDKSESPMAQTLKNKDKKHLRIKERETRENSEERSNNGDGSGEIIIEENMKIELLVKEEPIDWDDDNDQACIDDMDGHDGTSKSVRTLS
ncbi:unnamed protein product [Nesidiocoris tenuis]|uniref:BTB domain-containing protein n=1 Tax=Nesidiocoris tenuis TaxID=355587 RepID=A0A6H5HDZ1_9HEMI|nr:unnamed protein product [Nesidiocoris tenuis]